MASKSSAGAAKSDARRHLKITDPKQRIVAARLRELEDLFSAGYAALPPEARLTKQDGKAEEHSDRVRNHFRMFVVGAAVRLGLDLGCGTHDLHGHGEGRTQVAELAALHYMTTRNARELFDALLEDKSEIGQFVAERYRQVLSGAQDELAAIVAAEKEKAARKKKAA